MDKVTFSFKKPLYKIGDVVCFDELNGYSKDYSKFPRQGTVLNAWYIGSWFYEIDYCGTRKEIKQENIFYRMV